MNYVVSEFHKQWKTKDDPGGRKSDRKIADVIKRKFQNRRLKEFMAHVRLYEDWETVEIVDGKKRYPVVERVLFPYMIYSKRGKAVNPMDSVPTAEVVPDSETLANLEVQSSSSYDPHLDEVGESDMG